MSLLVVGTVALDDLKTPFGERANVLGGSATHFAIAASFFTDVAISGVIGEDFPEEHQTYLRSRGINLDAVEKKNGKTFHWKGEYGFDLNTAITRGTELGVLEAFHPRVPATLQATPFVFLANVAPGVQNEFLTQIRQPKFLALDSMNLWIKNCKEELIQVIRKVDAVFLNEGETRQLTEEPILAKAARKILSWGPKALFVKQGEYGALLFQGSRVFSAPGLPLESVFDPTGAGDSFAGGAMGYLARTGDLSFENLQKAVIVGSVMASFNVEDFGPDRLRTVSLAEIRKRAGDFRELAHFEEVVL
ncbi:MAG: sugar kinase [Deltaproteobacteria bacterium]|nr:sugar kinase [Deltaproteobacteria bacterium]